jgi:hypothetical protein
MATATTTYQTDTVSSTARSLTDAGFTTAELNAADSLRLTFTGGDCRYRTDGTDPTASVGDMFQESVTYHIKQSDGIDFTKLNFIRESADCAATYALKHYA